MSSVFRIIGVMTLKYIKKQHETGDIWSFFFEPLEKILWQAGQYLNLTMPDVPPVYGDRLFTISSAPFEKHIRITTFIGESPFKQKLKSLEAGAEVEADQLGGDFYWFDEPEKKLYLAGGLGITPFRSIIVDRFHNKLPQHTVLMWSGRDEQRPFDKELFVIAAKSSDISVQIFSGLRITPKKILEDIPDISERLIYIAGSQEFVESLGEGLMVKGIPRSRIKYDWFDGYTGTLV